MVRLITFFLKHPVRVILFFVIAAMVSGICSLGVSTNYDFSDYLPENAQSTVGLGVFKDEFGQNLPNTRVLYQDATLPEALSMKNSLEKIPGVLDVIWLDDIYDLSIPLQMENGTVVEEYYRDKNALYTVTISKDTQLETVAAIRTLLGDRGAISGSLVETADAMSSSAGEVPKIMLFAVPLVLLVLLLTTSSWIEPLTVSDYHRHRHFIEYGHKFVFRSNIICHSNIRCHFAVCGLHGLLHIFVAPFR
jgi:uncharacterized protein